MDEPSGREVAAAPKRKDGSPTNFVQKRPISILFMAIYMLSARPSLYLHRCESQVAGAAAPEETHQHFEVVRQPTRETYCLLYSALSGPR